MKFFLAAGHSLTEPGAGFGNRREESLVIGYVDEAVELLKTQNLNGRILEVVPHSLGLVQSVKYVNDNLFDASKDLCMEVHLNSNSGTPGTGTETFYGHRPLAKIVNNEVVSVLGLRNRGVKTGNHFFWNNSTRCASCLLELGFINNNNDMTVVEEKASLAIARAIVRACGGSWINPITVPEYEISAVNILPQDYVAIKDTVLVNISTGNIIKTFPKGTKFKMYRKTTFKGRTYFITQYSTIRNIWNGIPSSDIVIKSSITTKESVLETPKDILVVEKPVIGPEIIKEGGGDDEMLDKVLGEQLTKQSERWKLNLRDLYKTLTDAFFLFIGTSALEILKVIKIGEYGDWTPIVITITGAVSLLVRRWIRKPEIDKK